MINDLAVMVQKGFDEFDKKMEKGFVEADKKIQKGFDEVNKRIEETEVGLRKEMQEGFNKINDEILQIKIDIAAINVKLKHDVVYRDEIEVLQVRIAKLEKEVKKIRAEAKA
jgi:hypothetical protein